MKKGKQAKIMPGSPARVIQSSKVDLVQCRQSQLTNRVHERDGSDKVSDERTRDTGRGALYTKGLPRTLKALMDHVIACKGMFNRMKARRA
jgi:hypothetical protein